MLGDCWSRAPQLQENLLYQKKKSKETVPERSRRESSTTAFKAAVKIGGLSYPHKGKGAVGRGIEDKGQKRIVQEVTPIPTISVGKRGRLQKAVV